jgi:hypothetical protein
MERSFRSLREGAGIGSDKKGAAALTLPRAEERGGHA